MATNYSAAYNERLADEDRYRYRQAQAESFARTHYLSHGERFERMIVRYTIARREGRFQAAAAIKRAANRIVDEMPI